MDRPVFPMPHESWCELVEQKAGPNPEYAYHCCCWVGAANDEHAAVVAEVARLRALLDPTNETAVDVVAAAICPGSYCEAHSECRDDAAAALAALSGLAGQPTNQEDR